MLKKPPIKFFFNHTKLAGGRHRARRIRLFSQILKKGLFFSGNQVHRFIKNLHSWLGESGFVTTVASDHDAILLSLQPLKLKPQDEVIFPVNSYPTAFPIALFCVKAVVSDVDENE